MTVEVGTGDLSRALRVQAGRVLIAVSRHLSRTGARLLGHPSGGAERPPLRSVPTPRPSAHRDPEHAVNATSLGGRSAGAELERLAGRYRESNGLAPDADVRVILPGQDYPGVPLGDAVAALRSLDRGQA